MYIRKQNIIIRITTSCLLINNNELKTNHYYLFRLMNSLPDDIIMILFYIIDKNDLYSFKSLTKHHNVLITHNMLAKVMLTGKINKYSPIKKCVNAYCYRDTKDLFYNVYMRHNTLYRHSHQMAINKKTIIHKKLNYEVVSPYCYICFMTYIMREDFPKHILRIG